MLGQRGVGAVHRRRRRHDHVGVAGAPGRLEHLTVPVALARCDATGSAIDRGTDGDAARCTTASAPSHRVVEQRRRRGWCPRRSSTSTPRRFSSLPVERSSSATTSCARAPAAGGRGSAPMKPAPPVTTMLTIDAGYATGTRASVPRLFLSPPDVGDEERALLLDAFDSNWIAPLGPHVDAFEQRVRRVRRRAGRRRALERHRRAPPRARAARGRSGRRGARPDAHVRRDGQRGRLRGRAPGVRRQRAAHLEPRPRAASTTSSPNGPRGRCAAGGGHRRRPLRAVRRAGIAIVESCDALRRADRRGRRRGARRDATAGRPAGVVRRASASSRSTATRSSPRAAAGCS